MGWWGGCRPLFRSGNEVGAAAGGLQVGLHLRQPRQHRQEGRPDEGEDHRGEGQAQPQGPASRSVALSGRVHAGLWWRRFGPGGVGHGGQGRPPPCWVGRAGPSPCFAESASRNLFRRTYLAELVSENLLRRKYFAESASRKLFRGTCFAESASGNCWGWIKEDLNNCRDGNRHPASAMRLRRWPGRNPGSFGDSLTLVRLVRAQSGEVESKGAQAGWLHFVKVRSAGVRSIEV